MRGGQSQPNERASSFVIGSMRGATSKPATSSGMLQVFQQSQPGSGQPIHPPATTPSENTVANSLCAANGCLQRSHESLDVTATRARLPVRGRLCDLAAAPG